MRNASDTVRPVPSGDGLPTWLTAGRWGLLVVVLLLVLLYPQTTQVGYLLSAGVMILNYALMATGWNFMGGFTGYLSLGHAAYFGIGAYATAILIGSAQVPHFLALVLGALITTAIAVPIGIAALRVRGSSFVIVTIAFVLICLLVFQSWGSVTGGSLGLTISRPFPDLIRTEHHRAFFYIYLAVLALALAVWWAIDRSRFGMGLKAIREDEDKARSLGVPTFVSKLVVFCFSALFVALAGGLYAIWFGRLDPVFQFSILLGAYMVLMSLLGGLRSLFGPVLGAVGVGVAIEFFVNQFGDTQFHLVATGLLLALVVLFMPDGVIPAITSFVRRRFGPQAASIREISAAELAAERDAEEAASKGGHP